MTRKRKKRRDSLHPRPKQDVYEYVATQEYIVMRSAGVIWRPGPSTLKALAFNFGPIKIYVALGENSKTRVMQAYSKL